MRRGDGDAARRALLRLRSKRASASDPDIAGGGDGAGHLGLGSGLEPGARAGGEEAAAAAGLQRAQRLRELRLPHQQVRCHPFQNAVAGLSGSQTMGE